jgi:hypothetical protein
VIVGGGKKNIRIDNIKTKATNSIKTPKYGITKTESDTKK